MSDVRNEGYDDLLDALEAGEGYYLQCKNGHGSLPPRRACPQCGSQNLEKTSLPETGSIETHTTIHVATPSFVDDTPYITAIVDFGAVRLTGKILTDGMESDTESDTVERGMDVTPVVGESKTTGERLLGFEIM